MIDRQPVVHDMNIARSKIYACFAHCYAFNSTQTNIIETINKLMIKLFKVLRLSVTTLVYYLKSIYARENLTETKFWSTEKEEKKKMK